MNLTTAEFCKNAGDHPHRCADGIRKNFRTSCGTYARYDFIEFVNSICRMKKMLCGQNPQSIPAENKMFGAYRSVSPYDFGNWVGSALPVFGRHRQWAVVFAGAVDSILVLLLSKSVFHQPVTSKCAGATVLHCLYRMRADRFGSELGSDLANVPHGSGLERMAVVERQFEFSGTAPRRRARHTSPDLPHLTSPAFVRPDISEANNRAAMRKPSMSRDLTLAGRENRLIPQDAPRRHRSAIIARFFPQYLLIGDVSTRNALCDCA